MVTLAMVALVSAGCSNAPAEAGRSAGTGSSAGATTDVHEQALKFAECMRDNGVTEFPDPDAQGAFTIEAIANGSSVDTESTTFTEAETACVHLEPAGFYGAVRTPEQQEAALEFAQCIRDNGVTDFPDPGIDDPLVDTYRIPSSNTEAGMSILNAAMQQCDASAAGVEGP